MNRKRAKEEKSPREGETGAEEQDSGMTTTLYTVTDGQIRQLGREAAQAGDTEQVALCRLACGDEETATQTEIQAARGACVAIIADAEAQS